MNRFYKIITIFIFCLLIINTNKSNAQAWFGDITSPMITEIDFGLDINMPGENGDSTKTALNHKKQKGIMKWAVLKRKNKNSNVIKLDKNTQDTLSNIAATRIKKEE